jgi:hypothetical protein
MHMYECESDEVFILARNDPSSSPLATAKKGRENKRHKPG